MSDTHHVTHKHDGRKAWIVLVIAVVATFTWLAYMIATDSVQGPTHAPVPPCAAEDGPPPCYWDAHTMGNGQGRSYTLHTDGTVTYWDQTNG